MSTIKQGYRITVTSWENDADGYSTITVDGLSEEVTRLHVDILKLISQSRSNNSKFFGNMYEPGEVELNSFKSAIVQVLQKHNKLDDECEPLDFATDVISDYTGYGSEGFFTRVAESIHVEYVPHEITIEDVSHQFGV